MPARQKVTSRRSAFTLVEIVVVIIVIGAALAVVAPSFIVPPAESGVNQTLTAARRAALRRGETMTLVFHANGSWIVQPQRSSAGVPVLSGTLDSNKGPAAEVRISPIGICALQHGRIAGDAEMFDPLTCSISTTKVRTR